MRCVHLLLKRAGEIRKFHVIIVERWQRNLQKSVMLVQSCFAYMSYNFFAVLVAVAIVVAKLPIVLIQKFCYHGNMTSLFNNVITPASQWSANTHFTLSITPFVTSHLRATYPAHFHLIDAMCLTMSFYCRQEFSCVAPFVSDLSAVSSSPLPFAQISACTLRTQGFSNFTFAVDM